VQDGDLAGDPVRVKPYFDRLELLLDPGLDLGAPLAADAAHRGVDRPQLPPHLRVEAAEVGAAGDEGRAGLVGTRHAGTPSRAGRPPAGAGGSGVGKGQDRPGRTRRTRSEWATMRARRLTRCSAVSGRR